MRGTATSFEAACAGVPGNKHACVDQLVRLTERLADFGTLHSLDQFRYEGDRIYAIKARCGLRAYGWFDHHQGRRVFVISHYILKRRDRFDARDRDRVLNQRLQYKEIS
jgi:hypothetical protein